ncbi:MAG: hypothetical protein ING16_02970 [Roseomonas sp.]|nr:hypothetical protein [Roseomonas sp.]MCA3281808.1 hypothetical protein [Roseomonas sp.]MCA3297473.1 hypothetical protein [Roseomonas sp.]
MMRVFAGATAKSMPVMGSLVLLLLAMLWPFQSALAQDRRVVAVETEVRGIVFRIPRAHLHIRDGDGSFDLGLRVDDLSPIRLIGLPPERDWREAMRVRVSVAWNSSAAETVAGLLQNRLTLGIVQTREASTRLDGPNGPPPPDGLIYFPARGSPAETRPLPSDIFKPIELARNPETGEEWPEFFECNVSPRFDQQPTEVPFQPISCEWYRVFRGLVVQTSLERCQLAHWRRIRDELDQLLNSFIVRGPEVAVPPIRGGARPSRTINPVLIYDDHP